MWRLEANENWSLFDPLNVRSLSNLVGDAFTTAYESHEQDGLAVATIPAGMLWDTVCAALRESGAPFLLYSDNIHGHFVHMHVCSPCSHIPSASAEQPHAPRDHQSLQPVYRDHPAYLLHGNHSLHIGGPMPSFLRPERQHFRSRGTPSRHQTRRSQS